MFARTTLFSSACRNPRVIPKASFHPATSQIRQYAQQAQMKRFKGTVIFSEGKGADEWVTIEEDVTKNYFTWVIWPYPFWGIHDSPLKIGDRVSFLNNGKNFKASNLIMEATGQHPGHNGQELTH